MSKMPISTLLPMSWKTKQFEVTFIWQLFSYLFIAVAYLSVVVWVLCLQCITYTMCSLLLITNIF